MNKNLLFAGGLFLIAVSTYGSTVGDFVEAIYRAEGAEKARHPYGIVSVRYRDKAEARAICLRTVHNNLHRWRAAGRPGTFTEWLANVYAPLNAGNDPRGLNRHWRKNVEFFLKKRSQK